GVLHAAMVLDDCLLVNLNAERWRKVLAPKMLGAWNLHQQTLNLPIEMFVCYSSMSAVFGVAGQGNYAASNLFLDALAHHRRALGLPALTVSWGYLGEVGYVARHEKIGERFENWGVRSFTRAQALTVLGRLLHQQAVHTGVMRIQWSRWQPPGASSRIPPRFSEVKGLAVAETEGPAEGGVPLRQQLLSAEADK